jgi:hypothetical protein
VTDAPLDYGHFGPTLFICFVDTNKIKVDFLIDPNHVKLFEF